MTLDVTVVGCGPVGVMTALRCAQRGLSVTAIDKSTGIYPLPRAIGMDEEIQRLFQNAGLESQLKSVSTPIVGAEFVDPKGNRLVGLELPEGTLGPNGYPPMTMFDQPSLETALREKAIAAGVTMELGVEATAVENSSDGVTLTAVDQAGHESTLRSRWLVAADGGASTMRRIVGVKLEDQGFDEEWVVVDTAVLDRSYQPPRIAQQVCDPQRVVTIVPGHRDRLRFEFRVNQGESGHSLIEESRLDQLLSPWAMPDQLRIDRSAVYRFHAVVAETFRVNSVFLAGDCAHQMPPFNGQGMNSGLRDADNLSWKLAFVHHSRAEERLLDTYDIERRPHARGQVEHAADTGRLINALTRGEDVSTEAGYGGGRPFPHIESGLVCGDHAAIGNPIPQPTIDGIRLDDILGIDFACIGNPSAVSAASDATRAIWDKLRTNHIDIHHPSIDQLRPNGETIIVRPDRYVAAITSDLDATTATLAARM